MSSLKFTKYDCANQRSIVGEPARDSQKNFEKKVQRIGA